MKTSISSAEKPINILLVEDNKGDAELASEALREATMFNKLFIVYDGEEAMNFLHHRKGFENVPRPDIVILDLNLPKKDGREVLEELKADDSLKLIPVVILTTSMNEDDISMSYSLHANCFISKPLDYNRFLDVVKQIENFWMSVVTLPKEKK